MTATQQALVLAVVVFASFLIETATGFGSMVVALSVGALWFPLDVLLGWLVPVSLVLSGYLVARGWQAVSWRFLFARVVPLMTVGLVGGVLLAGALRSSELQLLFGGFVAAVAAWQLRVVLATETAAPLPAPVRVVALLGAGLAHGVFATGGPLAVFVTARELPDKGAFRATLAALWVLLNALLLPQLFARGLVSASSLSMSGLMLAPLALGIGVGEWVHHHLDPRRFRAVVAVLLLVAGGVAVASALRGRG